MIPFAHHIKLQQVHRLENESPPKLKAGFRLKAF